MQPTWGPRKGGNAFDTLHHPASISKLCHADSCLLHH